MKNLKVLVTVLCVACATKVWGEKISNYTNIVSGQKYRIGATTSNTDYYLKVDGSKTSTGTSGTAVTSAVDGTIFVFEGSGASWTIKFDGTSYYLSLANNKANGKVNVVSSASTFTLSNKNNKIRLSIGSYSVQKNNSGTQFGSYGNTQTDVWLEPISGSIETTPSITQHPEDATYDQGAKAAALTITASGNPTPTYQWYSNTSNKNSNGTVISGETKDSYTPSTASTGIFYYYCVATNSQGSASSNVATITVNTVINYTVRWSLGGDEYAEGNPTTSVKSGERVTTLPTPPDGNAIGSCANTFMGWSTHDLGTKKGQSAPTDLFTTIEGSPVITQDTIFYAVFAKKKEGN